MQMSTVHVPKEVTAYLRNTYCGKNDILVYVINDIYYVIYAVVFQSPSHGWPFVTPWTVAYQASLSLTISQSLPKFLSIAPVMPSSLYPPYPTYPLLLSSLSAFICYVIRIYILYMIPHVQVLTSPWFGGVAEWFREEGLGSGPQS